MDPGLFPKEKDLSWLRSSTMIALRMQHPMVALKTRQLQGIGKLVGLIQNQEKEYLSEDQVDQMLSPNTHPRLALLKTFAFLTSRTNECTLLKTLNVNNLELHLWTKSSAPRKLTPMTRVHTRKQSLFPLSTRSAKPKWEMQFNELLTTRK